MLPTNGQEGRWSGLQEAPGWVGPALSLGTSVLGPLTPLRAPLPPTGALEIGQALPIHTGRYTCTARNSAGVAHKHVALTVQGKDLPVGAELEAGTGWVGR